MEIKFEEIFNKNSIIERAKENWDFKTKYDKMRASKKYNHIFVGIKKPINDWNNLFDNLTTPQKNVLIKGELIRTYDGLPNIDKTKIKNLLGLSEFSSKWYKLSKSDKVKLLKFVI